MERPLYPHLMRHTFASHALSAGMDLTVIQHLLGHTDPKTTLIYAGSIQSAYSTNIIALSRKKVGKTMDKVNDFKLAVTAVVALLTSLWGWFGWLVVLFVGCMAVDYLTGTAAAMHRGEWSSKSARDGIFHKIGSVIVVMVAGAADLLIGAMLGHLPGVVLPFEYTTLLCPLVVVWYTLTELGSIVENAVNLGAPVPQWLKKMLSAAKDAVDKLGEEND